MKKRIPLEKAALQVCIDSEKQPRIYQLTPRQGRIKLDEVQDAPVAMYPASVCTVNFDTGRWGIIQTGKLYQKFRHYFLHPWSRLGIRKFPYP